DRDRRPPLAARPPARHLRAGSQRRRRRAPAHGRGRRRDHPPRGPAATGRLRRALSGVRTSPPPPPQQPPRPMPVGVLVTNLGSPAAPTTAAVRRYLRQFLSDPRVIDIPAAARAALVNLVIVPFRSPRSAEAYGKIWTAEGSPLLVHGRALREALAR